LFGNGAKCSKLVYREFQKGYFKGVLQENRGEHGAGGIT
jgi:hypothetical protein